MDNAEAAAEQQPSRRALRRFLRNRMAVAALVVLILLHAAVAAAPLLTPHSPEALNLLKRLRPPSADHLLGTDEMGRDILARLLYGGRVSLGIGLAAMGGAVALGTMLGSAAGFRGGWVDAIIMRITDAMMSFPLFFFLLTVLALLGSSIANIVAVIALTSWMNVARIVRAEVLRIKQMQFVEAARALGSSPLRVLFRHVLPHCLSSVVVSATLGVGSAILTESALSYLGLGVTPPAPSWGNMLNSGRSHIWTAPHLVLFPGAMIFITVLAYNALGDGLRDALDPASSRDSR